MIFLGDLSVKRLYCSEFSKKWFFQPQKYSMKTAVGLHVYRKGTPIPPPPCHRQDINLPPWYSLDPCLVVAVWKLFMVMINVHFVFMFSFAVTHPTSPLHDPPHPLHHPLHPSPYMTHPTPSPTWPTPPLADPPHPAPFMTHPHPFMTHPTPGTLLGTKEPFSMGCFTMSPFR